MAKGLYFYKLISPYEEDVTKNCKLTVNEIDSNFLNLKDEDIKSAELDEVTKSVILTRNNGDKLVVDLTPILSGAVYDLEVVYENPDTGACSGGSSVYVKYSILTKDDIKQSITVPITGLVTTENINDVLGGNLLTKVTTDSTLQGNGTKKSPLGISDLYRDTPAIRLIDKTNGEELPETPQKGDKYVTKEKTSDFGQLYNRLHIEQIKEILKEEFGDDEYAWHVPNKDEWDCLLNSVEPCDPEYRNHGEDGTNIALGKYAGKKLKATCAWLGEPDCECKNTRPDVTYCEEETVEPEPSDDEYFDDEPVPYEPAECDGTDEFGMRILPTGIKGRFDAAPKKTDSVTAFWTDTLLCDSTSDYYIKMFMYDHCDVIQESANPNDFYSLRLVKKYDGENYVETETIDGNNYRTLLFPECEEIWIESNFATTFEVGPKSIPGGNDDKYGRIVYYINVWNGKRWEKRALNEGESIVLIEGNEHCLYNIEYRVFLESDETGCNNQVLVSSDEAVAQRVERRVYEKYIVPLSGAIDTEREERISADTELWEALSAETAERIDADEFLQGLIEAEEQRAKEEEERLQAEIDDLQEEDQKLWDAIEQEREERISADTELWEALSAETAERIAADEVLSGAIDTEREERIADVEFLSGAVDTEREERIADVEFLSGAVDTEIERAKSEETRIECQIIDNPENPMNDATPTVTKVIDGVAYYILKVNGGLTLYSKCGTNDIPIRLDADFGTF